MPTVKQLNDIWVSEYEFFGGAASPKQIFNSNNEGFGMIEEQWADSPVSTDENNGFSGEIVGSIRYDEDTDEIIFEALGE